ncbi:MAG: hypothetical protein EZS28_045856 [Streblomastix strix]|uniref:USP domain-containing protein n=1 Tax=Streblomastix strix TaxID=222440 RepID=A0A5J4TK36_9EUKA|nr:MAG: hypothetical protein EZS28_045856 [Streblomastix strix]
MKQLEKVSENEAQQSKQDEDEDEDGNQGLNKDKGSNINIKKVKDKKKEKDLNLNLNQVIEYEYDQDWDNEWQQFGGCPQYSLFGLVVHKGSLSKGHYTSYFRLGGSDQTCWYIANDGDVHTVNLSDVMSSQAYILFYEQIRRKKKRMIDVK